MIDPLDPSVTEALRSWRIQHDAGIALVDTLKLCANVCQPLEARVCFEHASNAATKGIAIEALLQILKPLFSQSERAIIAAGWNGGRAESAFDTVVDQRELWHQTRCKIRSKLVLPIVVLVMASLIAPLPGWITSDGSIYAYLFSAFLPILIAVGLWKIGTKRLQRGVGTDENLRDVPASKLDRLFLQTPILKNVERQRCIGEFSTLLSNFISAGIPIMTALDICHNTLSNGVYRETMPECLTSIRKGGTLCDALQRHSPILWPKEFIMAVEVGERSGKLDESLMRQAAAARENFERAVDAFAEWLPKVLYGCVALFVIYNIITMFSKIVGMYNGAM